MKLSFNLNQTWCVFFVGALLLPINTNADVFKWKDKDGSIRYSDTPPPSNVKQEPITGKKVTKPTGKAPLSPSGESAKPTETVAVPAKPDVAKDVLPAEEAAKLRQQKAEADKKAKDDKAAEAKVKAENCKTAKANNQTYVLGGRVTKMNEKGERQFLGDKELAEGVRKSQEDINKYCN